MMRHTTPSMLATAGLSASSSTKTLSSSNPTSPDHHRNPAVHAVSADASSHPALPTFALGSTVRPPLPAAADTDSIWSERHWIDNAADARVRCVPSAAARPAQPQAGHAPFVDHDWNAGAGHGDAWGGPVLQPLLPSTGVERRQPIPSTSAMPPGQYQQQPHHGHFHHHQHHQHWAGSHGDTLDRHRAPLPPTPVGGRLPAPLPVPLAPSAAFHHHHHHHHHHEQPHPRYHLHHPHPAPAAVAHWGGPDGAASESGDIVQHVSTVRPEWARQASAAPSTPGDWFASRVSSVAATRPPTDGEQGNALSRNNTPPPSSAKTCSYPSAIAEYARAMATERRSAALNAVHAPPAPGVDDYAAFVRAADLPDVVAHVALAECVTAPSPAMAAAGLAQWRPAARAASGVAVQTLVVGQMPYFVDAAGVGRLLAELAATDAAVARAGGAPFAAQAILAVRAHERARTNPAQPAKHQGTRRCGLWFVEVAADGAHRAVLDALLATHRRALVSDTHVTVVAGGTTLERWAAARDGFLQRLMEEVPDVRRDAHSRFQKGLGPVSIQVCNQPMRRTDDNHHQS